MASDTPSALKSTHVTGSGTGIDLTTLCVHARAA